MEKTQWYWHCCGDRDQKIVEESALMRIPKRNDDKAEGCKLDK